MILYPPDLPFPLPAKRTLRAPPVSLIRSPLTGSSAMYATMAARSSSVTPSYSADARKALVSITACIGIYTEIPYICQREILPLGILLCIVGSWMVHVDAAGLKTRTPSGRASPCRAGEDRRHRGLQQLKFGVGAGRGRV